MGDWLRAYLNGRVKWEYLVDSPDGGRTFTQWLDRYGQNGWELIAVRSNGECVFKRGKG